VSAGQDGKIKIWSVDSGELTRTLETPQEYYEWQSVAISPDGTCIAGGGRRVIFEVGHPPNNYPGIPSKVVLWDMESGAVLRTLEGHTGMVEQVSFSPDGKILASGGYGGEVRLWDFRTGTLMGFTSRGQGDDRKTITSMTFSPGGKMLVSGDDTGTIKTWRLTLPAPVKKQ